MNRSRGRASRLARALDAATPIAQVVADRLRSRRSVDGPGDADDGGATDASTTLEDFDPLDQGRRGDAVALAAAGEADEPEGHLESDDVDRTDADDESTPDWAHGWDPFEHWSPAPTIPRPGLPAAPRSRVPQVDPSAGTDASPADDEESSVASGSTAPLPRLPRPTLVADPVVRPVIPPSLVDRSDAQVFPGAPDGWQPQEVDVRGLVSMRWQRSLVVLTQLAVFPAALLGVRVFGPVLAVMVIALATWSWHAAENARRAKPRTSLRPAIRPARAAAWWIVPAIYTLIAIAISAAVDEWAGTARSTTDRDVILFAVRSFLVLGGIAAWYWPFGRVVSLARWVGGSGVAVRKWFWYPVGVSLVTGVSLILLSLSVVGGFGVDPGSRTLVVVYAWVAIVAPMAITALMGQRAMLQVEGGTKETFQKRSMPPIDPSDLLARRARLFDGGAGADRDAESDLSPAR